MPEISRRLTTILAADVAGYSRLAGADEEGTVSRLRALRQELIDPVIATNGGRVVKTTGDGRLVEFASVVDAVRGALEVQRGMASRNANVAPEKRIEFRVGIHLGDVIVESDGDLMGDGVNIAARLEGICEPGGVCLSEDAWRQVRDKVAATFTDLGDQDLKNIARPVRAYAVVAGGASMASPAVSVVPKKRPMLWPLGAAIAALLIAIAGGAWYFLGSDRAAPGAASAANLSIVVLPFTNLSGDPSQDHLADIIVEELTTYLSRIPGSFVIARNTAFTYKGKPVDVKQVGSDLGVRYVLEGSTETSANLLRVNVQLIDAESGAHVWADKFDADRTDLLQMQDELVARLTRTLHIQLTAVEAARVARVRPSDPAAEDLAMKCESIFLTYGSNRPETEAGYQLCQRALDIDPNNVRALVLIAEKYIVRVINLSPDRQSDIKHADELVTRALAIDPNHPFAHHVRANVLQMQGRFEESMAEDERALALDPSEILAYQGLAISSVYLGQPQDTDRYADIMIRLSPRDPQLYLFYGNKALAAFMLQHYDEAIGWYHRALADNPEYALAQAILAAALALDGQDAEARQALARYMALRLATARTVAQWKARGGTPSNNPLYLSYLASIYDGLRKAGMPEQ